LAKKDHIMKLFCPKSYQR